MALALTTGCAPGIVPMGPPTGVPALADGRFTAADGAVLPVRAWHPKGLGTTGPKAVILALHGFNDYSNSFADAGAYWAGRGILTYAYDQRGFGAGPNPELWAGTDTLTADLAAVARQVRVRHPGVPLYLLGDSMGGAVVMVALAREANGKAIADGVVLVAPAVWGRELMHPIQNGFLWVLAHIIPQARLTGEGLHINPSDNIEMLKKLSKDPLVIKTARVETLWGLVNLMDAALAAAPRIGRPGPPVLVMYGMLDEVVPNEPSLVMVERMKKGAGRIAIYKGGYHMLLRDLKAKVAWQDIAAWTEDPAALLPSTAEKAAREILEKRRKGR